MPKMKTHKGVKKRFRATAKNKIKHRRAGTSHLNSRMTQKRTRHLRRTGVLLKPDTNRLLEALAGNSY
jgi:large subunit ribosomal protein L35